MPSASSAGKLVALRRIQVPKNKETAENIFVEPGEEFTPVSEGSRERLLRVEVAAEPNSKEAKRAKRQANEEIDSADESE